MAELEAAARLFRRLKENGCRVLNDPGRVRTRFSLLRALYRAGLNPFNAYGADEEEKPKRFPVFVRRIHGHGPPLSDRIGDQLLAHACVHDTSWIVKTGRLGIAEEGLYDEELQIVRENRFAAPKSASRMMLHDLLQTYKPTSDGGRPCAKITKSTLPSSWASKS